MPPTSDEQIKFLVSVQRLLDEGLLVATSKFALLLSLADLSIELGDDSGAGCRRTLVRNDAFRYNAEPMKDLPVYLGLGMVLVIGLGLFMLGARNLWRSCSLPAT